MFLLALKLLTAKEEHSDFFHQGFQFEISNDVRVMTRIKNEWKVNQIINILINSDAALIIDERERERERECFCQWHAGRERFFCNYRSVPPHQNEARKVNGSSIRLLDGLR